MASEPTSPAANYAVQACRVDPNTLRECPVARMDRGSVGLRRGAHNTVATSSRNRNFRRIACVQCREPRCPTTPLVFSKRAAEKFLYRRICSGIWLHLLFRTTTWPTTVD